MYIFVMVIVLFFGSTNVLCLEEDVSPELRELLGQVDHLVSHVCGDRMYEIEIFWAKLDIIRRLSESLIEEKYKKNKSNEFQQVLDLEAPFFQPKEPQPLSEQEKKINVIQRIEQKYVGKIPDQIENVIFYLNDHHEWLKKNTGIYNRVLLHGNPGTGKSHLITVLAQELQVPVLSFSASFFADKYIGESSRKIRKAFETAKQLNKPVILFIDELDALASKRRESMHEEQRATLITLLTELQNIQDNPHIVVLTTTNDLKALDRAARDRFGGSVCEIKHLSVPDRAHLFKMLFDKYKEPIDMAFATRLAEVTDAKITEDDKTVPVFSNRDIEYIVKNTIFTKHVHNKYYPQDKQHLAFYVRKVIDSMEGKWGKFATLYSTYSDGI